MKVNKKAAFSCSVPLDGELSLLQLVAFVHFAGFLVIP